MTTNSLLPSDVTDPTDQQGDAFSQVGVPLYKDIIGSPNIDALVGSDVSELLAGFGGNDYAYGGGGADLFVLGDYGSSYYTQQGWNDTIYIEDFTLGEDQLQLQGSASRYSTTSDAEGLWLYDQGDAIAFLKGVSSLDLTSESVTYVGLPAPIVEESSTEQTVEQAVTSDAIIPDSIESDSVLILDSGDVADPAAQQRVESLEQIGAPKYTELIGSPDINALIGGEAAELLAGFGGKDYAYGGGGADVFILGDYGSSHFAQAGWDDTIYIEDFTLGEDQLQLQGSASRYSATSESEGIWLYDQGDAIAFLKDIFSFDFNSDSATYVGLPEPVVEEAPVESDAVSEEADVVIPDSQPGIPQYEDLVGSLADDDLIGFDAAERFIGFGGKDYSYGGGAADLFVLGDFGGSYYAQKGWDDYSFIEDFTVGVDQLQLQGSASQYSTQMGYEGVWIYDQDDPIAYLKGVDSLDLGSLQYTAIS